MSVDRYRKNFGKAKPLPGQAGYGMKESERLMLETKSMEQKLMNLRNIMTTQKQESSRSTGGRWASARSDRGTLRGYNKDVKSGRTKSKVVKHKVQAWGVAEVGQWLRALKLDQYVDVFVQNEINGSILLDIGQDDLDYMQIGALGHRKTIMKELERLKRGRSTVVLQAAPRAPRRSPAKKVPSPPSPNRYAAKGRSPIESSPARKIHWSHAKPISENTIKGDGQVPVNLADGTFDERKQQESFQSAVMAWRNGGADQTENESSSAGLWTNPFAADGKKSPTTRSPSSNASPGPRKNLLEGTLDEAAEHAAFARAVSEWRTAGSVDNQKCEKHDAQPGPSPKRGEEQNSPKTSPGGGRLLKGGFNEADEHEKFRRAVDAWRNGEAPGEGKGSPSRKMAKDLEEKYLVDRDRRRTEFEEKKMKLDAEMAKAQEDLRARKAAALKKISDSKQAWGKGESKYGTPTKTSPLVSQPQKPKDYSNIWDVEIEY
jgi:hypothetical protein|eukprot:g3240.t1